MKKAKHRKCCLEINNAGCSGAENGKQNREMPETAEKKGEIRKFRIPLFFYDPGNGASCTIKCAVCIVLRRKGTCRCRSLPQAENSAEESGRKILKKRTSVIFFKVRFRNT